MSALLNLVERYGLLACIPLLLLLFLRILLDEDRSALWRGRIFKAVYAISGRAEDEKQYIRHDLRGRLNLARRRLCANGVPLPVAIDVQWVDGGCGDAYDVADGEFVVRLDPSTHQERNIALLAMAIVRRTTLQGIRHLVERPLATAIDLNLVRTLLTKAGNRAALDWFLADSVTPALGSDPAIRDQHGRIARLDERGIFTHILLIELSDFAARVQGREPRPFMVGEVEGLVNFLYDIAACPPGAQVPLQYSRAFIKLGVILVAKPATLLRSVEPYIHAMQINLERGIQSIYALVLDKEWLGETKPEDALRFIEQLKALEKGLAIETVATLDFDVSFECLDALGRSRRARCIRYVNKSALPPTA